MITIDTIPADILPAFNPIMLGVSSNITDKFTSGALKVISSIQSNGGYVQLNFSVAHSLLVNQYILITSAPGATTILGVALITSVPTTTSVVIDKVYVNTLSANGECFLYLKSYNMLLFFYVFVSTNENIPILASTLRLRPNFRSGLCMWDVNLSSVVKDFNFNSYLVSEVLSTDVTRSRSEMTINKKSFVKYGYEVAESFIEDGKLTNQAPL